jgi:pimeloyl-ACP methyl ester carboxylesterase
LPQRFIEVGDRTLSVVADGSGETGVILETGLEAPSEWWEAVQSRVAAAATVWRYDRAGTGESSPAETPRTADDLLRDLEAVVTALPTPRVILVGNSLGGALARLYAHRHPGGVSGIVLVDSFHAAQFDRIGPMLPAAAVMPAEAQGFHAFWAGGGWRDPAQNREGADLPSMQRALQAVTTLGDLPLVVLVAGAFLRQAPPPANAHLHGAWLAMQSELASLSTAGTLVRVDDSGHFIQRDRPDVVADAIERLLSV